MASPGEKLRMIGIGVLDEEVRRDRYLNENDFINAAKRGSLANFKRQPVHDGYFDLDAVPYLVYERFFELLKPGTNHFFRKTSKRNYQQCFDIRGIEVGELNCADQMRSRTSDGHGNISTTTGALYVQLPKVPKEWTGYLVVTDLCLVDEVWIRVDPSRLNFVKKYKSLFIDNKQNLSKNKLEQYFHPNLEEVTICDSTLDYWKSGFKEWSFIWAKLNECKNPEHFKMWFPRKKIDDEGDFEDWKECMKELHHEHRNLLEGCVFDWEARQFKFRNNVLCFCFDTGMLVDKYRFEDFREEW